MQTQELAFPRLIELQHRLGLSWPTIERVRERAEARLTELRQSIGDRTPSDTSVVVFGSIARGEVTVGSDVDWTLLVDSQAYPGHLAAALDIDEILVENRYKKHGIEGTFGGLAFSHDIVHYIGGQADTNRNTTQRILLLLESRSVGSPDAYIRVKSQVLKRYVSEDFGLVHGTNPSNVPRFLLNDIVRYWRTVAVDFAYKRRERKAKGWALRTVKLRLSRKLTYASGLVACFSCASLGNGGGDEDGGKRVLRTVDHLEDLLRNPPLEILAFALLSEQDKPDVLAAAGDLYSAYDEFLALLDDESKRSELDALLPDEAQSNAVYNSARQIGSRFQDALNRIFLDSNGTQLHELMRTYGVF